MNTATTSWTKIYKNFQITTTQSIHINISNHTFI